MGFIRDDIDYIDFVRFEVTDNKQCAQIMF